jgi:hypothetical protein
VDQPYAVLTGFDPAVTEVPFTLGRPRFRSQAVRPAPCGQHAGPRPHRPGRRRLSPVPFELRLQMCRTSPFSPSAATTLLRTRRTKVESNPPWGPSGDLTQPRPLEGSRVVLQLPASSRSTHLLTIAVPPVGSSWCSSMQVRGMWNRLEPLASATLWNHREGRSFGAGAGRWSPPPSVWRRALGGRSSRLARLQFLSARG